MVSTLDIDDVLARLGALNTTYATLSKRFRMLSYALVFVAVLSGFGIVAGTLANAGRIADIQSARNSSILYACHQQNVAHMRTLVFLDETQLKEFHTQPLLRTYPTIEVQTLRAIHRLPLAKRRPALRTHRLLLAFINNLARQQNCRVRLTRFSSGAN